MTNNVNISRETVAFGRTATVHRCDHGCGETLNELSVAGSMGSLIAAEIARCERVVIGLRGGGDGEYIESNATVGQLFALLRLIEGLDK